MKLPDASRHEQRRRARGDTSPVRSPPESKRRDDRCAADREGAMSMTSQSQFLPSHTVVTWSQDTFLIFQLLVSSSSARHVAGASQLQQHRYGSERPIAGRDIAAFAAAGGIDWPHRRGLGHLQSRSPTFTTVATVGNGDELEEEAGSHRGGLEAGAGELKRCSKFSDERLLATPHGFMVMMFLCSGGGVLFHELLRTATPMLDAGGGRDVNVGGLTLAVFQHAVVTFCPHSTSFAESVDHVMRAVARSFRAGQEVEERRRADVRAQKEAQRSSRDDEEYSPLSLSPPTPYWQPTPPPPPPPPPPGAAPSSLILQFHMFAFELLGAVENGFVAPTSSTALLFRDDSGQPPRRQLSAIDIMIAKLAGERGMDANTRNARGDDESEVASTTLSTQSQSTTSGTLIGGYFRSVRESSALRVLQLTLGTQSPLVPHLVSFLQSRGARGECHGFTTTHSAKVAYISKDFWYMMYLFCLSNMRYPTFEDYSETDSWPSLLDEFVAWSRAQALNS